MANQPEGEYASANYEDCSIWRWVGWMQEQGLNVRHRMKKFASPRLIYHYAPQLLSGSLKKS